MALSQNIPCRHFIPHDAFRAIFDKSKPSKYTFSRSFSNYFLKDITIYISGHLDTGMYGVQLGVKNTSVKLCKVKLLSENLRVSKWQF